MKLATIVLASALTANAQPVPMTPGLAQSIQGLIASTVAVCQKRKIGPEQCEKGLNEVIEAISKKVEEVCKDYPKEREECVTYGLEHLMDNEIRKNIIILRSQDA